MKKNSNRLEALQVLRAIAAGMVVYVHALATYQAKVKMVDTGNLSFGFSFGEFGVQLFFCISGFIIFSSSQSLESNRESVSYFIRRRLIRIVPLYWCATLIYGAKLALQGMAPGLDELAYSLLFLPHVDVTGLMRPVLGAGWTLNYEMFFYLVLGGALFLARTARLVIVSAVMILLVVARIEGWLTPNDSILGNVLYLLSETYLLFFVAGIWVGPISRINHIAKLPKFGQKQSMMLMVAVLVLLISLSVNKVFSEYGLLIAELLACVCAVLLCVVARRAENSGETGFIGHSLVLAGDGSYSTYLTHGFVMGPAARFLALSSVQVSPLAFALVLVAACTLVGMFIFRFFETPLLDRMNAKWGRM